MNQTRPNHTIPAGCLHIGTKLVKLTPMNRGEYNAYRGWLVPADECPDDEGYLVEYNDGGTPNHPAHAGYISWSPKAQADAAYRPTDGMPFGMAMEAIKQGLRVARKGWNGAGMFVYYVPAASYPAQSKAAKEYFGDGAMVPYRAYMALRTADGSVAAWAPSGSDALADDWYIAV